MHISAVCTECYSLHPDNDTVNAARAGSTAAPAACQCRLDNDILVPAAGISPAGRPARRSAARRVPALVYFGDRAKIANFSATRFIRRPSELIPAPSDIRHRRYCSVLLAAAAATAAANYACQLAKRAS